MSCSVCGATADGGQFCMSCGQPLAPLLAPAGATMTTREPARDTRNSWLALQEIRLLACPRCGAPNSAARWHCARCGTRFDEQEGSGVADAAAPGDEAVAVQPEAAPWLLLVTVVAGVAVIAVAAAMLSSRGVGPFEGQTAGSTVAKAEPVPIVGAESSGAADPSATARTVIDGGAGTAWRVDAQGGQGTAEPWIELQLGEAKQVDHLLIWNGDQSSAEAFHGTDRIRSALIMFPDAGRGYRAEFEDIQSNFRVDIPDAPLAEKIRIVVLSTYDSGSPVVALSEVEALAASSPAE